MRKSVKITLPPQCFSLIGKLRLSNQSEFFNLSRVVYNYVYTFKGHQTKSEARGDILLSKFNMNNLYRPLK